MMAVYCGETVKLVGVSKVPAGLAIVKRITTTDETLAVSLNDISLVQDGISTVAGIGVEN